MSGINKVILIGNLGNEPEHIITKNGLCITNINVATSEHFKDKNGEKKTNTEWHKVVLFDRLAEIARDYLHKGSKVYIEGKLKTEKYEKDGIDRYVTKIIVQSLQMLDAKKDNTETQTPQNKSEDYQAVKNGQNAVNAYDDLNDDIPF